jgi:prophage antirepressor-like protein
MTSLIEIVEFDYQKIKIYGTPDEPWFCGKDVAITLGYANPTKAIRDHVDDDDKNILSNIFKGSEIDPMTYQAKTSIYINESGLYSLILKSQLPKAKEFQRWITKEILPALRKHGKYILGDSDKQTTQIIEMYKKDTDRMNTIVNIVDKAIELSGDHVSDIERVLYKDLLMNSAAENSSLLAKSTKEVRFMKPLSDVVMDITGKPFKPADYCPLGKAVASEFRKRYPSRKIDKCERKIDGGTRMINCYESKDLSWIEDIVRHYFDKKGIKCKDKEVIDIEYNISECISKITVD